MNTTAIFILVIAVFFFIGVFIIPRFLLKRAVNRVIQIFRVTETTNFKNAKSVQELGLAPRGFFEGMFRTRDYKPFALDMLRRADIVITTEEGKIYLSEDRLANSKLAKSSLYKK